MDGDSKVAASILCFRHIWCYTVTVVEVPTVDEGSRKIAESVGSTVMLSCRSPNAASRVEHVVWDFHQLSTGFPTVIYDGSRINDRFAGKYNMLCNRSSTICDLRVNHLRKSDAGEYHCYLVTANGTLKFVYSLSVTGW